MKYYYASRIETDGGATEIDGAQVVLADDYDRLREALKEAVAWIEDDRFDDDYISEEWYHMATKALEEYQVALRRAESELQDGGR